MGSGWLAALAGWLFTYYNSKLQEERKQRIERVNTQLREFYGPLLACVTATQSAYEAMIRQHSTDGSRQEFQRAVQDKPDGPEAQAYRLWMTQVLQPMNEKAAAIITENIDLLEASTVEPLLLQLVAHVSAYRVILEQWRQGELAASSAIKYPDKLSEYISREFARLKRRQAVLLGTAGPVRSKL